MSFKLQVRPVPPCDDPAHVRSYLEEQRELLLFLVKKLNHPGCGIEFDTDGALAVNTDGASTVCPGSRIAAVAFAGMVLGNRSHQGRTLVATGVID